MLCCCPGTITADLAALVPQGHVTGLEHAPDVLEQARATAARRGLVNIDFAVGDVHALDYPDGVFDIVHAHQVRHCAEKAKKTELSGFLNYYTLANVCELRWAMHLPLVW